MPFPSTINVSTLDGTTGLQVSGVAAIDQAGWSVSSAGDLNDDGIDDFIVAARGADPGGVSSAGTTYVVFGTAAGFPAEFALASIDGTNGFRINGGSNQDLSGHSVSRAGDVNGDGIDDIIIGAIFDDPNGQSAAGRAYVVYGRSTAFGADLALSSLDGTTGFKINGVLSVDYAGYSVAAAGDVNGDGIDDVIVGARGADAGGYASGSAFVVFGSDTGFAANFNLSGLDGTNGFRINGAAAGDFMGHSLGGAGDINGDGFADIIVGAYRHNGNAGAAYVVFGSDQGFDATLLLSDLDGSNGFAMTGPAPPAVLGFAANGVGDVNGDGLDDFAVSSFGSGLTYVVFGTSSPFAATFDLTSLNGANGFRLTGLQATTVTGIGDVNGDTIDDMLVGASTVNGSVGAAYVVFGRRTGFSADIAVSGLTAQTGVVITGEFATGLLGRSAGGGGDFNNDGLADIILGARGASPGGVSNAGAAYIIFGQQGPLAYVGGAGDDTRDGTALSDSLSGSGGMDTLSGLDGDDTLDGGDDADVLDGGDGADRLYGGLGADDLVGGQGADLLDGGSGIDAMAGGAGDDTYIVDDSSDTISEIGGEGSDRVRASASFVLGDNLENLTLEGSDDIFGIGNAGANVLDGNSGANTLGGGDGNDLIRGGAGDDILSGDAGADQLLGGQGEDDLDGGDNNDRLEGGDGNDTIIGGVGADILDGGADNDSLTAGAGADQLLGGAGTDTLDGGADNDILNGGTGADAMTGGTGDDTFFVDDAGDTTIEALNEGTDTVRASLTWTLSANVERLILDGAANLDGTGNGLANVLTGNGGANVLDGGAGADNLRGGLGADTIIGGTGADILQGGGGADSFLVRQESVYSSLVPGGRVLEVDTISDFSTVEGDVIDLSAIDAIAGGADDAFTLVGVFSNQAGQMTLAFAAGTTTLRLDIDGDGLADYLLKINGDVRGDSGGWLL